MIDENEWKKFMDKWQPVFDASDFPRIEEKWKRKVTSIQLERPTYDDEEE
jgi:hypothetical protein